MCIDFKNNRILNFINKHVYSILIIALILTIGFFIFKIYLNIKGYSDDNKDIFEAYNGLYTTLIIASITLIGILFNLRDNRILRNQQSQERIDELDRINKRQENIRLLISIEVNNNLDILREFKSDINYLNPYPIEKPSCTVTAWNSSYDDLASVFSKDELRILMEFYGKLEKLLDDKNWLKRNNGKVNRSSKSFANQPINFLSIRNNKTFILDFVEKILSLEYELDFLEEVD